jgi:hypothetical protein
LPLPLPLPMPFFEGLDLFLVGSFVHFGIVCLPLPLSLSLSLSLPLHLPLALPIARLRPRPPLRRRRFSVAGWQDGFGRQSRSTTCVNEAWPEAARRSNCAAAAADTSSASPASCLTCTWTFIAAERRACSRASATLVLAFLKKGLASSCCLNDSTRASVPVETAGDGQRRGPSDGERWHVRKFSSLPEASELSDSDSTVSGADGARFVKLL